MPSSNLAVKISEQFTYADYLTWNAPYERWEIIDGDAYNMSLAPLNIHQEILGNLAAIFHNLLKGKSCRPCLSPFDVRLPDFPEAGDDETFTVVQPDLFVLCDQTKLDKHGRGLIGAPDLVVEILSPSTKIKDLKVKLSLYERHQVREYWIISPLERTLMIFKLNDQTKKYDPPETFDDEGKITTSTVLRDAEIDLAEIFGEK